MRESPAIGDQERELFAKTREVMLGGSWALIALLEL